MATLSSYHKNRLKQIEKLIEEHQYEVALEYLTQEIESPYIPSEFSQRYEQLYYEVTQTIMVDEIKHKYDSLSKLEILGKIYNGKKLDLNLFSFFISKFHKEIDDIDLQYINKIFKDPKIENQDKIFILSELKMMNIDYDFNFFNNKINKEILVPVITKENSAEKEYYLKTKDLVERQLFKDPTSNKLCGDLLSVIFEYYFGSLPPYSVEKLSNNLANYVCSCFDNSIKPNFEFKNWLDSILSNKKPLN